MMHNKGLTKLMEECGELVQIAAKRAACSADMHWDGLPINSRLEDEIADVEAICAFVKEVWKLDTKRIYSRKGYKIGMFQYWHVKEPNE